MKSFVSATVNTKSVIQIIDDFPLVLLKIWLQPPEKQHFTLKCEWNEEKHDFSCGIFVFPVSFLCILHDSDLMEKGKNNVYEAEQSSRLAMHTISQMIRPPNQQALTFISSEHLLYNLQTSFKVLEHASIIREIMVLSRQSTKAEASLLKTEHRSFMQQVISVSRNLKSSQVNLRGLTTAQLMLSIKLPKEDFLREWNCVIQLKIQLIYLIFHLPQNEERLKCLPSSSSAPHEPKLKHNQQVQFNLVASDDCQYSRIADGRKEDGLKPKEQKRRKRKITSFNPLLGSSRNSAAPSTPTFLAHSTRNSLHPITTVTGYCCEML